jgi:hypothetical protein
LKRIITAVVATLAFAAPAVAAVTAGPISNPTINLLGQREVRSTITSTRPGIVTVTVTRSAYRHAPVTTKLTLSFTAAGSQVIRVTCKPIVLPFAWSVTAKHPDGSSASSYATLKCS